MKEVIKYLTVVVVIGWLATLAMANGTTIADGNATAVFELGSQMGMRCWEVDDVDHMSQQWFWYRIGDEQTDREYSIDTLSPLGSFTSDTNDDPRDDTLAVLYGDPGGTFTIECRFVLTGGTAGSGTSTMTESISIINTGAETLDFHFFQYCNFDLNDMPLDEKVEITGGNTATQEDVGCTIAETVVTSLPDHYEAALLSSDILGDLNDNSPTTLGDVAGPLFNDDLTWAFQWDFELDPDDTFVISKVKHIVPEPAVMILLVGGAVPILLKHRRKAKV